MDLIENAFSADLTSTLEVQSSDFLIFFVTELVHFIENRLLEHLSRNRSPLK